MNEEFSLIVLMSDDMTRPDQERLQQEKNSVGKTHEFTREDLNTVLREQSNL